MFIPWVGILLLYSEENKLLTMKEIKNLKVSPRPHYLTEGQTFGNYFFQGAVSFPLSDPTLFDRKDHANTAHLLFAAWNIAHIFFPVFKVEKALAVGELKAEVFRTIPLETKIEVRATYTYNKPRRSGIFYVWFFNKEEVQLAHLEVPFRTF